MSLEWASQGGVSPAIYWMDDRSMFDRPVPVCGPLRGLFLRQISYQISKVVGADTVLRYKVYASRVIGCLRLPSLGRKRLVPGPKGAGLF
jgi:hypothetical protein